MEHLRRVAVAVDKPDPAHDGLHPGENTEATARSVLFGVLQHVGAELSAHETITAEQDHWGSIAQLAAEYETIAAAAQHDRWAALIRESGLTEEQADAAIGSVAFGALTAELRRAEANQHDVETLLPRLVGARGFGDADDIAAVLHYRVAKATGRPAGSGRARKAPRLIAGLIPEATGTMPSEMWQALAERRDLIETRTNVLLDTALTEKHEWIMKLGVQPKQARTARAWRNAARTIAAYRDRYGVTGLAPLGARAETETQKLDAARARAALGSMNSVRLFGPEDSAGIVSFAIEGVHPHDVGTILDEERVAIRAGHHCAQPLMEHLGVPATARASFGVYNGAADVDALAAGLMVYAGLFQLVDAMQAIALGLGGQFEQIEEAYAGADRVLGRLVKVTPSSKVVGDLALALVGAGVSADEFASDPARYDIPDSVIGFLRGELGLDGDPEPEVLRTASGRIELAPEVLLADGRYTHFIERAYRVDAHTWGVFSLDRLARTPEFRQAAA